MRYKKAITGLNGYIPRIMLSASSCLLTIGCANLHTRSNMESSPKSLGEISSGSISPPAPGDNSSLDQLYKAVQGGKLEVFKPLFEQVADVNQVINQVNSFGRTLVFEAAAVGSLEICKYLCDKGADINIQDISGWFPLTVAISEEHEEVFLYLLGRQSSEKLNELKNAQGRNVLHVLLEHRIKATEITSLHSINTSLVTSLLNGGVDPNAKDNDGNTAFHIAVKFDRVHAIPLLKDYGADIGAKNKVGDTPLHMAPRMRSSNSIMIKTLLDNGADKYINEKNNDGTTPLLLVMSAKGSFDDLELLLANGANPNVQGNVGQVPAHLALKKCMPVKYIQLLLKYGAKPDIKDNKGVTPYDHLLHLLCPTAMQDLRNLIKQIEYLNIPDLQSLIKEVKPLSFGPDVQALGDRIKALPLSFGPDVQALGEKIKELPDVGALVDQINEVKEKVF